ncbi:hypothetical protein H5400_27845 [Rhodococcus wratislaviensis]|nr:MULTISPECIES: hypothetical protein [unclassified Rhodococcus (in: high G+C Gram-positive bacteria)]MBC2642628.1 hypothetical protein [Rhodococcus sp. 3A]MBC2892630.1 hypothetical protein [Rhodococcus sp. 4CII]
MESNLTLGRNPTARQPPLADDDEVKDPDPDRDGEHRDTEHMWGELRIYLGAAPGSG